MWMVRFVTFVQKDLFPDKYLWKQMWQIWTSTSTGTMVFCWSCKQSWSWTNAKKFLRFLGLMRSRSSNRILYRPANGREISSSLFGQTRRTRLYFFSTLCLTNWVSKFTLYNFLLGCACSSCYLAANLSEMQSALWTNHCIKLSLFMQQLPPKYWEHFESTARILKF